MIRRVAAFGVFIALGCAPGVSAQTETLSVIYGGRNVGHLKATTDRGRTTIDFDFKNNGRGPTLTETIAVDSNGIPTSWRITGSTTFGSMVDERFTVTGAQAEWTDSNGRGTSTLRSPSLYVPQSASPWYVGLLARAILSSAGQSMPALPAGTLTLEQGQSLIYPKFGIAPFASAPVVTLPAPASQ